MANKHKIMEPMGVCFPQARLSEAWTPYQHLMTMFDHSTGLFHGTIFPELVRPYTPKPNSPEWY
ncbi:MAG TPA: spore coat associated protein CotJA [Desulfobacteria bacterium]|nr:spore coat associated protein CotJA [Desulfobacteria bacterium]